MVQLRVRGDIKTADIDDIVDAPQCAFVVLCQGRLPTVAVDETNVSLS